MKRHHFDTAGIQVIRWTALAMLCIFVTLSAYAQETVFTMMRSDAAKADAFYAAKDYRQAATLYETMTARSNSDRYVLPIARCYYHLHQPKDAANWYDKFLATNKTLPEQDVFLFAETLSALKQYDRAIQYYTQYQGLNDDDALIMKKIWRLKNKEYLYEDSIHYSVKKLTTNSTAGDVAPVMFGDRLVFLSNRERVALRKASAGSDPFFRLYEAQHHVDTLNTEIVTRYDRPVIFGKGLGVRFQQGPVCFYDSLKRMAYIASGQPSGKDKSKRTLQLFFAERDATGWHTKHSFVYNNNDYSIYAAAVSHDGTTLYFASDMPGGFGGQDLYVSSLVNGQWSKPVNLGEAVNTSGNESYPALYGPTLYFTSDGHAGLGGLDVFSVRREAKGFGEPQNMGYPINTNFDDFGLTLNADGSKGYFSSNRQQDNDDIYEVTIDLQSYPYTIAGLLKYKEEGWRDADELKVLPHAQLFLIDNLKGTVVQTVTSDASGGFTLTIPYFSQYRIKVQGDHDGEEAFVSLDLSRRRAEDSTYEMVVVKNNFKKTY